MKQKYKYIFYLWLLLQLSVSYAQNTDDVALFQQYNGRYSFTFIGNTMNLAENNVDPNCEILTSSSAILNMGPDDEIINAYLYWAGSGEGDFEVKLNDIDIVAERTFSFISIPAGGLIFFSAFADVTDQVLATGNGEYTLSELDLTDILPLYCPNATNFAGWAIVIVYKNDALPLNQVNIYDGLQGVPTELSITLDNLNVIDSEDAQIGFIAWEGDSSLAINETLRVNGNIISDPPLNPPNNAFNSTNSITGSNQLYNMDLDIYSIEDNIQIGDETVEIQLTSGQDFVMINVVVTKLNNQLPDATITIDDVISECDSRELEIHYTVYNNESTNPLPAATPIAFYANNILVGQSETQSVINIDESESGSILVSIPASIPGTFELKAVADDLGNGEGIVIEIDEENNSFSIEVEFMTGPELPDLENLTVCDTGLTAATFDMSAIEDFLWALDEITQVSFHETYEDAVAGELPISDIYQYYTASTPKEVFIRVKDENCPSVTSFLLLTRKCEPTIYNFISINNDGKNDEFIIKGLLDIFTDFRLFIYNRWGKLIWEGKNEDRFWDGTSNTGTVPFGKIVPEGTYYYVLELNDEDYPKPLTGYLYLTH